MSHILPRFTITWHTDQLKIDRIIGTSTASAEGITTTSTATLPGDTRRLRGIPVAGGACGTSPGTDPLGALLHKDNQVERKRKK